MPEVVDGLTVQFDKETQGFSWTIHGTMPASSLIGILALIQSVLLDKQKMEMAMAMQDQSSKLVLPNGPLPRPMKRQ